MPKHPFSHLYEYFKLYKINPCDADSFPFVQRLYKPLAFFASGTECKCCLGSRVVLAAVLGLAIGILI